MANVIVSNGRSTIALPLDATERGLRGLLSYFHGTLHPQLKVPTARCAGWTGRAGITSIKDRRARQLRKDPSPHSSWHSCIQRPNEHGFSKMAHHQKQESKGSSFASHEVKDEGNFSARSELNELEVHMVWSSMKNANRVPSSYPHPTPSSDPKNPLNWPTWLRHSALLVACAFFLRTYSSPDFSVLLFPYPAARQIHADKIFLRQRPF